MTDTSAIAAIVQDSVSQIQYVLQVSGLALIYSLSSLRQVSQMSPKYIIILFQVDEASATSLLVANNYDLDAALQAGMVRRHQAAGITSSSLTGSGSRSDFDEAHVSKTTTSSPTEIEPATGLPDSLRLPQPPQPILKPHAPIVSQCLVCYEDLPSDRASPGSPSLPCGHGTCNTW